MSAFALKRMTPWPTISKPPCDVCESTRATAAHGHSFARPFVHDNGDTRSLHFTLDELQSRMNKRHPWRLEVDYTRTMMGFLLLVPEPASIGMVGLGGGSLAKFCYRQLPACRITVVEINPYVIALRRDFCVPDDDAHFEVLQGDGAGFVAASGCSVDVLLVDGFDHAGQSDALCSQRFFMTTVSQRSHPKALWPSSCTTTMAAIRCGRSAYDAVLATTRWKYRHLKRATASCLHHAARRYRPAESSCKPAWPA